MAEQLRRAHQLRCQGGSTRFWWPIDLVIRNPLFQYNVALQMDITEFYFSASNRRFWSPERTIHLRHVIE